MFTLAATGFWLLVAAYVWFAYHRVPKASLASAAATFCIMVLAVVAMPPGYSPGEVDRIKRLHVEFAPMLETYRQEHGAYPPTLETAGIPTPRTKYGPLQYNAFVDTNGQPAYKLSMGEYAENGFVTRWDSSSGRTEWSLDM